MLDSAKMVIGEKDYILSFPLSSIVKAEKVLGKPIQAVFINKNVADNELPEFSLGDLIALFKLGMKKEQPTISDDRCEELLEQFLSEGQSLALQATALFMILGKALGFFRTEIDIQKKLNAETKKVLSKKG